MQSISPVLPATRVCRRCGLDKPLSEFGTARLGRFGRRATCKACCKIDRIEYVRHNAAKVKAKDKRWREAKNAADPTWMARKKAAQYAADPLAKEKQKQWKAANRHKVNASQRRYDQRHPEYGRMYYNVRRARRFKARIGTDRKAYLAFVRWAKSAPSIRCYWCNRKTTPSNRELDHILPLAKDGPDDVHNLCVSCEKCNGRKHHRLPEEFSGQFQILFPVKA